MYLIVTNFRDFAKKYVKNVKNTFSRAFNFAIFFKTAKIRNNKVVRM